MGLTGGCWAAVGLLLAAALPLRAQNIRYDSQKTVVVPDYSTIRIGQFYSTIAVHAAVSYRYTRSSGEGSDYLIDGERGRIREDGSDFPLVVALDFRNYVPLSKHSDVDISVRVAYRYFPMETQENEWTVTVPDESITANFSTSYQLSRNLQGILYDKIEYLTDYVDTRGFEDDAGGQQYSRLQNRVGTTLTWLLTPVSDLIFDLYRRDVIVTDNQEEFGNQERVEYHEGVTYQRRFFETIRAGVRAGATQRDFSDKDRADTTQYDYDIFVGGSEGGGIPITEATTLSLSIGTSVGKADSTDTTESEERTTINGSATLRTQLTKDLAHQLGYSRGLRSGFDTAFEEYDQWSYSIDYNRVGAGIRVFSNYETVDTTTDVDSNPYDVWNSGVAVVYPLFSFLTLDSSYTYRVVYNNRPEDGPVDDTTPAETQEDYYARVVRIGTALKIMKEVTFRTYVERYERLSDLNTLEFTRDTFDATLAYSHQF